MQMFLMLLSDQDNPPSSGGGKLWTPGDFGDSTHGSSEIPLLESLLRALEHDPEKIDRIKALVDDLMSSNGVAELLPEGFNDIWPAIWAAREGLK